MATWTRLDPTTEQSHAWWSHGLCLYCGSLTSREDDAHGRCYCRHCSSCTSDWKAATVTEMDEGRPHREECPECVAANGPWNVEWNDGARWRRFQGPLSDFEAASRLLRHVAGPYPARIVGPTGDRVIEIRPNERAAS